MNVRSVRYKPGGGVELVDVEVGDPSPMQVRLKELPAAFARGIYRRVELAVAPRLPLRRDTREWAM